MLSNDIPVIEGLVNLGELKKGRPLRQITLRDNRILKRLGNPEHGTGVS